MYTGSYRKSGLIVDDESRILERTREENYENKEENTEFESDGYSLNLQNNFTIDTGRWTDRHPRVAM